MGMMKYLIGIIFIFTCLLTHSQEQEREVIDGKTYLVHIVESGNTLYGLHRKYNVPIEEIIAVNPSSKDGLQVGQKILIPTSSTSKPKIDSSEVKVKTHKVKAKETLFGISRKYGCTVDDLLEVNPEIEDGLKVGQEIIIPLSAKNDVTQEIEDEEPKEEAKNIVDDENYKVTFEDSIVEYKVQKGETLYSISKRFMVPVKTLVEINKIKREKIKPGDILIIPLKKERIEVVEVRPLLVDDSLKQDSLAVIDIEEKEKYIITILLPLRIDKNAEILSGVIDENTRMDNVTEIAVDFLMGAQIALDSLEKIGLTATVHVLDTEGSLNVLETLMDSDEVKESDLIFGPFYPESVTYAAKWAKENEKHLIIPVRASTEIIKNNPYVNMLIPSDLTLVGGMAKFLAQNYKDDHILIAEGNDESEKERIAYFKEVFEMSISDSSNRTAPKVVPLGSSSGRDLAQTFNLEAHNIFVCLAEDVQRSMQFINTLNAAKNYTPAHGKAEITVFGPRAWDNVSSLNSYYRNRFKVHTPSPTFISYDNPVIVEFLKSFRSKYNTDASKYVFQGFDALFSVCKVQLLKGEMPDGYINDIVLQQVSDEHGSENSNVFIVRQEDFELFLSGRVTHSPLVKKDTTKDERTDK